jgi:hypothetical protein
MAKDEVKNRSFTSSQQLILFLIIHFKSKQETHQWLLHMHAATAKATTKEGGRGKLKPKSVSRSSKVVLGFLKDFRYIQRVGSGSKWIQEPCFRFRNVLMRVFNFIYDVFGFKLRRFVLEDWWWFHFPRFLV